MSSDCEILRDSDVAKVYSREVRQEGSKEVKKGMKKEGNEEGRE